MVRAYTPKCRRFACLREAASAKAGHAGISDICDREKECFTDTRHGHGSRAKERGDVTLLDGGKESLSL